MRKLYIYSQHTHPLISDRENAMRKRDFLFTKKKMCQRLTHHFSLSLFFPSTTTPPRCSFLPPAQRIAALAF